MAVRIEPQAEPIPGYRLLERIGGGGFGEVWKAEAPGGLHKAIKFVYGDLQQLGEEGQRAEQELKSLSRVKTVRHPYILSLERYDIIDGQLIIVMELADKNLWDRFKECRAAGFPGIPRQELLGYLQETAEALDLMNSQYQLQHLDIKPQNLFLVFNHVKVADFGLVKDLEGMQASVTGGVTPVYAAPETFDGWVSRFSDQYSLAIVYQELLTGQRPFIGGNVRQVVLQHLQAAPNLSSLAPLEQPIIARSLAKNPDERFPTCSDMVRALRGVPAEKEGPPQGWDGRPSGPLKPLPPTSDSQSGTIRINRCQEPAKPQETASVRADDTDEPFSAPPEQVGDGVLFPALVVGIGQTALTVVQQIRRSLYERFGSLGVLPHLRFLYIDTDTDVLRTASRGGPGAALSGQEIVVTPLNRPAYYLRSVNGRPPIETWFNPKMLYRIPRTAVTLGCRALGRLAFIDHYRTIGRRLRLELETCLDPQALADAQRYTRLGVRTNRPRVYVVAGLGGGTGGGMFLDLAYVVRAKLRQLGYHQPDLCALLLAPPGESDDTATRPRNDDEDKPNDRPPSRRPATRVPAPPNRGATRTLALSNAVAALMELGYFGTPEHTFFARYHENEPPVRDSEPPFNRCMIVSLDGDRGAPPAADAAPAGTSPAVVTAAEFLTRELTTPLGRVADLSRADLSSPPWPQRGQFYGTFGLHCLTSPHRALNQELARELCADLVERWMSKDATPVKAAAAEWAEERWQREGWAPKDLSQQAQEFAENILGQHLARGGEAARSWEQVQSSALAPLTVKFRAGNREHIKDVRERDKVQPADVPHFQEALAKIEALVGWPADEETIGRSAVVPDGLRSVMDELVSGWGDRVAELVVRLIEQPGFRLAGAEEVVRQIVGKVEGVLTALEPKAKELSKTVSDTYARIQTLLQAQSKAVKGRPPVAIADVLELIRCYAQWRFDDLLRQQLVSAYVSLRGHWSDELREINFCRVRLTELHESFAAGCVRRRTMGSSADNSRVVRPTLASVSRKSSPAAAVGGEVPRGSSQGGLSDSTADCPVARRLFPAGCRTLEEAVTQYLDNVTPEDIAELDGVMQEMIRRDFRALVQVCLTSANVVKDFEQAMQHEAEAFVTPRLAGTDPAELFLEQAGDDEAARGELQSIYDEATPGTQGRVLGQQGAEVTVLLTPASPEGQRVQGLMAQAFKDLPVVASEGGDDIVMYRETAHLPLADMGLFRAGGLEAYRQMAALDNFTPHTRTDITFPIPRS